MMKHSTGQSFVVGFKFSANASMVALIKKIKPKWQKNRYNGIGGKIEEGETPVMAMRREFKEEAGLDIPEDDWRLFFTLQSGKTAEDGLIYFFETRNGKTPYTCTAEQVESFAVENILGLPQCFDPTLGGLQMIPNLRWLLPMALDKDRIKASGREFG